MEIWDKNSANFTKKFTRGVTACSWMLLENASKSTFFPCMGRVGQLHFKTETLHVSIGRTALQLTDRPIKGPGWDWEWGSQYLVSRS